MLLLSSLFLSPKNKTFTLLVRLLRMLFIPICFSLFAGKRVKPIISWEEFMLYRKNNRGEATELIKLAALNGLIKQKRNLEYESSLIKFPFISDLKPKGFSVPK